MPSKQRVEKAKKCGVNPYAVAQSQKKKHNLSDKEYEKLVHKVTNDAIKNCGKKGK